MQPVMDLVLVLVVLVNFLILGTHWIRVCIRAAAFQGVLLSLLPVLGHADVGWRSLALALGAAIIKGWLVPSFLLKAMRQVHIGHRVEPFIGFVPSLLLGAAGTGFSLLLSGDRRSEVPRSTRSRQTARRRTGPSGR